MKVAYVCSHPTYRIDDPSGYATHIRELSAGFQRTGFEVSVYLATRASKEVKAPSAPKPHPWRPLLPRALWELLKDLIRIRSNRSFQKKLKQELNKFCPDIVYERIDYSGGVAHELAKSLGAQYILEIHAPLDEDVELLTGPRPLGSLFNRRIHDSLEAANKIVVVSGVIRSWLIQRNVKKEKIMVASNGVNLELFDPQRMVSNSNVSTKDPAELWVGFVGSDLVWHRLDSLVEAFSRVPPEIKAKLIIVGPAFQNDEVHVQIARLGLKDRVQFLGNVTHPEVPAVVSSFDICVMPASNRYGSPIKLFEYGAMGKAVILPDEIPVREVVEEGKDAILVPSADVERLSEAIIRLARDSALRERLGRNLAEKIRSKYGWERVAHRIATASFVATL